MAETRVQIAYHFKIDPAQLVPGLVRLPEQITRTVSVGDEFKTEKVSPDSMQETDRAALVAEIEKQCREATRTARPAGASEMKATDLPDEPVKDEISAF
jgi:hypothetical protein